MQGRLCGVLRCLRLSGDPPNPSRNYHESQDSTGDVFKYGGVLEINNGRCIWEVWVSGFWQAILPDTILLDTESTIGVTVFGPGLKGVRKVRKDFP